MARLVGPVSGPQLAYQIRTDNALSTAGTLTATVYSDAAGTVLADILTVGGAPITGSVLTIGSDSLLPVFQFPDGADTVYVSVNGGPVTAVYAKGAAAVPVSTVTAKGDLLVATGSAAVGRHGVGSDGQALVADSAQADGVRWGDVGAVDPAAAMLGLKVQTFPYVMIKDGISIGSGTILYKMVRSPVAQTISTLGCYVGDPFGTASGVNGMALYTEAGVLIDKTGDMSDLFTAGATRGYKSANLGSSQALTANTNYYLALLFHSSSNTFFGGFATGVPGGFTPVNGHYPSLINFGPVADFPASFTPSAQSIAVATIWFAGS